MNPNLYRTDRASLPSWAAAVSRGRAGGGGVHGDRGAMRSLLTVTSAPAKVATRFAPESSTDSSKQTEGIQAA
jgi:hypothetical protein